MFYVGHLSGISWTRGKRLAIFFLFFFMSVALKKHRTVGSKMNKNIKVYDSNS